MPLTQGSPVEFQLRKSYLMSKAHELSSSCDAEVLLIIGSDARYFAYSSFDRAESLRTILGSSNTKVLRPTHFKKSTSTMRDLTIGSKSPPRPSNEVSAQSTSAGGNLNESMSIDFLCTSPATRTAKKKSDNVSAPAREFALLDQLNPRLSDAQSQGGFPAKTHGGNTHGDTSSTTVSTRLPIDYQQYHAADRAEQGRTHCVQSPPNSERKPRRQKLAALDTDLHHPSAVPKISEPSHATTSSKMTENTRKRLPNIQAASKRGAIQDWVKLPGKDGQEFIEPRVQILVDTQREGQNLDAVKGNPLLRLPSSEAMRTLDQVPETQDKRRASLETNSVSLPSHRVDLKTVDETAEATQVRLEPAAPHLSFYKNIDENLDASNGADRQFLSLDDHAVSGASSTKAAFDPLHYTSGGLEDVNPALSVARPDLSSRTLSREPNMEEQDNSGEPRDPISAATADATTLVGTNPDAAENEFNIRASPSTAENFRPHTCTTCARSYKSPAYLKIHERTHTKPYKCLECPIRYARRDRLAQHRQKTHKVVEEAELQALQSHETQRNKRSVGQVMVYEGSEYGKRNKINPSHYQTRSQTKSRAGRTA